MDSLTQVVLGAATGEVVLGKKIGNKAMLFGAIAGTIPDLDVFYTSYFHMISHRGFTHSFFFAFLMAPIFAFMMTKIFKDRNLNSISLENLSLWQRFQKRFLNKSNASFKEWTSLYFWGFVTHILLDVQTIYGTELLWPIKSRLTTANVFVVDPLYTIPFLVLLIIAMFFKRNSKTRNYLTKIAIGISSCYLLLTFAFKGISYMQFTQNLESQNITYDRIETGPTPLNSILWFANVETDSAYYTGNYSLFDKDNEIAFRKMDKNFDLRKELEAYENFKKLNHFSKDWYLLSRQDSSSYRYENIRFGAPISDTDPAAYVFSYRLSVENEKLCYAEDFNREKMKGELSDLMAKLWNRILGEE